MSFIPVIQTLFLMFFGSSVLPISYNPFPALRIIPVFSIPLQTSPKTSTSKEINFGNEVHPFTLHLCNKLGFKSFGFRFCTA